VQRGADASIPNGMNRRSPSHVLIARPPGTAGACRGSGTGIRGDHNRRHFGKLNLPARRCEQRCPAWPPDLT
jgi:hypothetical protein